jgi:hypothetical protein
MNISDKYKLIFFHLPKCAGRSVTTVLDIKTSDKTNINSGLKQTTLLGFEMEQWNKKIYPEKWDNYMKFTIVRNPWDRVVSLYHFRKKENDLYKMIPPHLGTNQLGGDKVGPDGKEWGFKKWVLSSFVKGITPNNIDNNTEGILSYLSYDSKTLEEALEFHGLFLHKKNYVNLCNDKTTIPVDTPGGKITRSGWTFAVRDRMEWFNQIDILSDLHNNKLVDYILRFEYLDEMWNKMFEEIGYEPPKLPVKNESKHKHYSEYYDDESREFVGHLFKKDIETFGYKFEHGG